MFAREEEPKDINQERAEYVIKQLYGYQRDYAYPLGRLFTVMEDSEEARAKVLEKIDQSPETPQVKYAAKKLFTLHDALDKAANMQETHDTLMLSLCDPDLKLEYTSLIFGMYCNKNSMRHTSQNNLFVQKLYPNQSSLQWRDTLAFMQKYCFAKLKAELKALPDDDKKLALLRLAKKEMHIFFWKEADSVHADTTGTEKYRAWISSEIAKFPGATDKDKADAVQLISRDRL